MRKLAPTRRRRGPLGRAATMIEFTLVIPIFLFMMLFSVDMGMLMLTSGAMNDTAFSSARAGAQAGGAGYDPDLAAYVCPTNGSCSLGGISYNTAQDGIAQMPLSDVAWNYDQTRFQIVTGAVCRNGGADTFVTVDMPYKVSFFTPGLAWLIGILSEGTGEDGFSLTATGVARCELYRVG